MLRILSFSFGLTGLLIFVRECTERYIYASPGVCFKSCRHKLSRSDPRISLLSVLAPHRPPPPVHYQPSLFRLRQPISDFARFLVYFFFISSWFVVFFFFLLSFLILFTSTNFMLFSFFFCLRASSSSSSLYVFLLYVQKIVVT